MAKSRESNRLVPRRRRGKRAIDAIMRPWTITRAPLRNLGLYFGFGRNLQSSKLEPNPFKYSWGNIRLTELLRGQNPNLNYKASDHNPNKFPYFICFEGRAASERDWLGIRLACLAYPYSSSIPGIQDSRFLGSVLAFQCPTLTVSADIVLLIRGSEFAFKS